MSKKRILFTGGSGKAGKHVIPYLLNQGHRVLNVDLLPLKIPGVDNLKADITDSGQMFNAMSSYAGLDELEAGNGVPKFDAVVHFAAVPRILINPDNETFRVNTVGTYNVIEAAVKIGIKKVIIASSETTYGICFSDGKTDPNSLPLEEDYDVDPMDSYGLSKVVNEQTARAFQRRSGIDIYALRIGNVIEPHTLNCFLIISKTRRYVVGMHSVTSMPGTWVRLWTCV
jgi:nucleoside-diphosphate-sugar epimerase